MILIYFNKEIHLQPYSILGLIILGFLHLAGGNFLVGGFKLYQTSILSIPYDKIVHFVGSFIITFIVYNLVKPFLEKKNRTKIYPAFFIVFLISVGLGAMVEIVEFLATVIFERTIVGNYANNALDLVANTLGALIASGISVKHLIKKL